MSRTPTTGLFDVSVEGVASAGGAGMIGAGATDACANTVVAHRAVLRTKL